MEFSTTNFAPTIEEQKACLCEYLREIKRKEKKIGIVFVFWNSDSWGM